MKKSISTLFLSALVGLALSLGYVPGALAQQDVITTVVGGGPNGIPAINANLYQPLGMNVDKQGNYYFASQAQHRIFKVSTTGVITVVAGTGARGYSGDGGLATAALLNSPQGVAVDAATPANVYVSDTSNCLVRKVTAATGIITTIAGFVNKPATGAPYPSCGYGGDSAAANAALLNGPANIALNQTNNDLYVADYNNGRIRKIAGGTPTGIITTLAGGGGSTTNGNNCQGTAPYGDGAAANQSYLCQPVGVAVDNSVSPANVFISDTSRCVVREVVGSTGKIYQLAGTYGVCGFLDNVAANTGRLSSPTQLSLLVSGTKTTVTVADFNNYRIRQFPVTLSAGIPTPSTITTIAGNGSGYGGDGGLATNAGITQPWGLTADSAGNFYIGEYGSNHIRKITKSTGFISTVSGWGQTNYSDPVAIKNVPGTGIALNSPYGVFADPDSSSVYIAGSLSEAVYLLNSTTGLISNFAGNGIPGFAGDGTVATTAGTELNNAASVAKDSQGNVYIADFYNCAIREVSATTGAITTVVGGTEGKLNGCGYAGDGAAAQNARLYYPISIAIDTSNNLFIDDYYNCVIREVDAATKIISTYAGTNSCTFNGDGLPASSASLNFPQSIALDSYGNLYIADTRNQRIRMVDPYFGYISTVAGDGVANYTGDGVATGRSLNNPIGLAADANGNLFISDASNNILRWVDPAGYMVTFAGNPPGSKLGSNGFLGDGGPATSALLSGPQQIAQDSTGNFYSVDAGNNRVRKVTAIAGYGRSTSNLLFTKQAVGTTSEYQPVVLSAIGPITINSITATAGFAEYDNCAGAQLIAGETCEVDVYFTPAKVGQTKGTLSITSSSGTGSNPALPAQANTVSLVGTGAGLSVSGAFAFGLQTLGTTATQTITLSNSGASATLSTIKLATVTNYKISGGTCPVAGGVLAANSFCTISVTFTPKTTGPAADTLQIVSTDAASPILVPVTGTGVGFTITPASLTFPSLVYGGSEVLNLTIKNVGTTALTLSSSFLGSGKTSFAIATTGNTCGTSVAAAKSCVLPVQFTPTAATSFAASLVLTTNGGANPVIPLTGTATQAVSVAPTSLTFGSVVVGGTSILNVTVTNLGKITLTATPAISGTGAAQFSVLTTAANTCQAGVAAGKTCTLPVQFAPKGVAAYAATLTLTTNGGANPVIALTGTGAALVTATPATLAFGTVTSGTTSTLNVTLTNNGTSTIGVGSSISGTGAAAYSVLFTTANTCLAGLAPTKSCVLPVQFAPTAAGAFAAKLTLNAGATTLAVTLSGTGK